MAYDYDIVVIGGGPAGYAAPSAPPSSRSGSSASSSDKLGGICLNWGCIPTKALLTNAHLVELIKNHGKQFGLQRPERAGTSRQMIGRSRGVAGQLNKGIEGLFRKYKVNSKFGVAKVVAPHKVQVGDETVTAESIVIATGVRPRPCRAPSSTARRSSPTRKRCRLADAAEVAAHHRRRADRPRVRLLL